MSKLVALFVAIFSLTLLAAQPVIHSFSPVSGNIGATVTISGAGFGATTASNIVYFGAVKATVQSAAPGSLTVLVPAGATYQPISVTSNRLTAYSPRPFAVTFPGTFPPKQIEIDFEAGKDIPTDLHPNGVAIADFDGDGKPDVATANNYSTNGSSATVSVLRNTTNSDSISFAAKKDFITGVQTYSITTGDIDGDGLIDIVATSNADQTVVILKNTSTAGNITFAEKISLATGLSPFSVCIGDFDADGKPDLAVANYLSGTVSVFRNTSTAGIISFVGKMDFGVNLGPSQVIAADLNGDGKPDLATANKLSNTISVLGNNSTPGNILFSNKADFPTGGEPISISAADFDDDGKTDLAVSNNGYSMSIAVFRNTGTASTFNFAVGALMGTGASTYGNTVADFNGDGKPDLVSVYTSRLAIRLNTSTSGQMSFIAPYGDIGTNFGYNPAAGDLNGDGKPDVVVPYFLYEYVRVFRNKIGEPVITSFSPDKAGKGTSVTISGIHFTDVKEVLFGGIPAASFTINSDNTIAAVVDTGASGAITVMATKGKGSRDGFTFLPPPLITSWTPDTAIAGTTITINGNYFTDASAVTFGGIPAASFTVLHARQIQAVAAAGASGDMAITTPYGTGRKSGFTFIHPPTIQSFTPAAAAMGEWVTIEGTHFSAVTAVRLGEAPVTSFTIVSPTTIKALVGGGSSGNVSVTSIAGTAQKAGFVFNAPPPPVITNFIPEQATTGAVITVKGRNFGNNTATNIVFMGAGSAQVLTANDSVLTIKVPPGATLSPISVLNSSTHLSGYSQKSFKLVFTPSSHINPNTFAPKVNIETGIYPGLTAIGDMNNDGKADVVVEQDYNLNLFTNYSTPSNIDLRRTAVLGPKPNALGFALTLADLNGDGSLDIIRTINTSAIWVYQNYAPPYAGSFYERVSFQVAGDSQGVIAADFDGDGKPDLAATTYGTHRISILRNTSIPEKISFAAKQDYLIDGTGGAILMTDMDGDGKPEIITTTSTVPGSISIYQNKSRPGVIEFADPLRIALTNTASGLSVADINNDNKPDILVSVEGTLSVFKNYSTVGALSFAPKADLPKNNTPLGFTMGDITGDGKPEIVAQDNTVYGFSVYENTGTDTSYSFAAPVAFSGDPSRYIQLADMDGDGRTDVVSCAYSYTFISVIRNQSGLPYMSSFFPTDAAKGDTVTISGWNFSETTSVSFGGKAAASYIIQSDSTILAIVGEGASGIVQVTTSQGKTTTPQFHRSFVYMPPMRITGFSPTKGGKGTIITFTGEGVKDFLGVTFGGVKATYTEKLSRESFAAAVASGATGNVIVTTKRDTFTLTGFKYYETPVIKSFTPTIGWRDAEITIKGANFLEASDVRISGQPVVSFVVQSDSVITTKISDFNKSGIVRVTTPGGTASLDGFTYVDPPYLNSFTSELTKGDTVYLQGGNLQYTNFISFGGVPAASFTIVSSSLVKAVLGEGASGFIEIQGVNGRNGKGGFVYLSKPVISKFTPDKAGRGETVTITGANFVKVSRVSFGGVPARSWTNPSGTTITAIVEQGASGKISVTTAVGSDSLAGFTYIPPAPVLSSFAPAAAASGDTITIYGTYLSEAIAVSFGGVPALSFTILSDNSIRAVVNTSVSGAVLVITTGGKASLGGFTFIPPAPRVTSFTPAMAATGTTITITGINFTAVDKVFFGGVPATSFKVHSPTSITAVVGAGASGNITVSSVTAGSASLQGFVFVSPDDLVTFPNPVVNGSINARHPASSKAASIKVLDQAGKLIREVAVQPGAIQTTVNVSGVKAGLYHVIWVTEDAKLEQLVMIQ